MMWNFQIFLLLFYFCEEGQSQDWNVINKAADYGHNVTLFCTVNNCCNKNSGFDIFDPERRTLWIDIRVVDVNPYAKYVPFTSKEGFGMTIRNVTKEDLGIGYGCIYGLDEGEPKILTETLAFKGPDWIVLRQILKFGQHLTLLCPITNCCTELSTWQVYKTKQVEIYKNGSGLSSSKAKYVVGNSQNGFSLTINHLAKEDLNISYACKYGKRLGNPKILLEDDAFKIDADGESNSGGNVVLILVCPLLLIVIIGIVICVWRYTQKRKGEAKAVKHLNLDDIAYIDDDVSSRDPETKTLLPVEKDSGEAKPVKHLNLDRIACIEHDNVSSRDPETNTLLPVEKDSGEAKAVKHLNLDDIAYIDDDNVSSRDPETKTLLPVEKDSVPSTFVKSAIFDFTLLYSLIRHTMATIIPPPTQGWGNQPQSGNITKEDDIERIRQYRNKMAHNTDFLFKDSDFDITWADLSQAASRLSLESIAADISELKCQIFNCTNKTEVEKCIEEDIKEIKDQIKVIKNHQEDLQENSDQHIPKNIRGPSSFGRSADFDFILLYSLIRNTMKTIIPPPTQGWANQPQSGNITEEDDIERIRQYRNKMAHNTEFQISDFEFNTMCSDLSQAVSRLSLGSLAAYISEPKGKTCNCTYNTEVKKCITEDIKEIKDDIEAIKKDQSDLRKNIKSMKDDLEVLIQEHSYQHIPKNIKL